MEWVGIGGALLFAAAALAFFWRPLREIAREVAQARAREMFALERDQLAGQFLARAAATGKPRGLVWKAVDLGAPVVLARHRPTRQLHAFVPAAITFEALPGGDMEGVEAVANLRNATAMFYFEGGHWRTHGRALFNLDPAEALEHFRAQYDPVPHAEKP
jgi:hypothetical protein